MRSIYQLLGLRRRENLLLNQTSQLGFESVHHHILPRYEARFAKSGTVPGYANKRMAQ